MIILVWVLIVLICGGLLWAVLYARWNYGVLESMGVPVVKPTFLFGSIPNLHSQVIHEEDIKRFKELGPVFGVYEGRNPVLYVCDPEIIKTITVTEFNAFKDRRRIDFGNTFFNEMLDFLPYKKGKSVRAHFMPAFSSLNTKLMLPGIETCMDELLGRMNFLCGSGGDRSGIDIRREISGYMLGVAAWNMLGLKVASPHEDDNLFRIACEETIEQEVEYGALYSLSLTFPWLTKLAPTHGSSAVLKLKHMVDMALAHAKKNSYTKSPPTDFMVRMTSVLDQIDSIEYKKLDITKATVYGQAMTLFIVNYEGLTSVIVLLLHFLATNPIAQKRVQKEVDNFFKNPETDQEQQHLLPYLTACIQETLRLTPVPRRIERMCVRDCEINGVRIRKGVNVMVPLYAAHRNPTYFNDPEVFKPERFLPQNRNSIEQFALSFFGHGPRNCGGLRYTLDVVRFSAARLLHKFEFRCCDQTELKFKTGRMFIVQFEKILLDILKRDNC